MSLKDYLEKAYEASRLASAADLSPIQQLTGKLQHGCDNLILVYGGSFNPPHRGHLDVLFSGLHPVVAPIAVVILPSEDFHLRNKMANKQSEFLLPMDRRADIWKAIPSVPKEMVWVWSSTWYPFKTVLDTLRQLSKADGFMISISHLIGPDSLNISYPLDILPYELDAILVTNRARQPGTTFAQGKPVKWHGYGEWACCIRCKKDGNEPSRYTGVVLWTCTGVSGANIGKRGYYLHFDGVASAEINSTSLRATMFENFDLKASNLKQLSIDTLLELLAPIMRIN